MRQAPGMRQAMTAAALLALAGTAQAAEPAAQPFAIGTAQAWALRDGGRTAPNDGRLFTGASPAEAAAVLKAAGQPTDGIPLAFDALLVKLPGRVVLLDTGLGPKAGGVLVQSLRLAGVTPGAVTDILITHSHLDHVGGLVDAAGKPAFPRAKIRMTAPEWAFLKGNAKAADLVAAIGGQVVPFAPGTDPVPGIASIPLPGHTPGHSGYRIGSGARALVDMGDTAHSAAISLARPGWTIAYDTDDAAAKAQRQAELARLAESHVLVFAPHFPFPGVGHVVKAGAAYAWVPATF